MAAAAPYTDTQALANLLTEAYDRAVALSLFSEPQFRMIADTKPSPGTQPGETVIFQIHGKLAANTTPLDERTDGAGKHLEDTTKIPVTLEEYGDHTVVTRRLQAFALDNALDSNVVEVITRQMLDTVDTLVGTILNSSTNKLFVNNGVLTSSGSNAAVESTDIIKSKYIRSAVNRLKRATVSPVDGVNYIGFIHSDVETDLRGETGEDGWRAPQNYGMGDGLNGIQAGEVGVYERVRWISTPRCPVATGVGADGNDVYSTFIVGKGALAEAVAEEFRVRVGAGVVEDVHSRFTVFDWYGIAGWALYRPESLVVLRTASAQSDI